MLVPGAGEPHYDSRVADPFQVGSLPSMHIERLQRQHTVLKGLHVCKCENLTPQGCHTQRTARSPQGRSARREMEVAHLLDKLQPDMITLDASSIAQVQAFSCDLAGQGEFRRANASALARQQTVHAVGC